MRHYYLSKRKGVLLDSNLLTVLITGLLGNGEIEKFKRTRQFTTADFAGLGELIENFGWICTTPCVVAEVSNLLDWFDPDRRMRAGELLAKWVLGVCELNIAASEVVQTPAYYKLGFTDAALYLLARKKQLVILTADLPLYHYASSLGVDAINFHNLREQWL